MHVFFLRGIIWSGWLAVPGKAPAAKVVKCSHKMIVKYNLGGGVCVGVCNVRNELSGGAE